MMVPPPQRPGRERHSKSLSPRRPGKIAESDSKAQQQQQPGSAPRPTRLNQKSIDRVRRKGFPRAAEASLSLPKAAGVEFGRTNTERTTRATAEGKGRGKDAQSQDTSSPLSFDNAAVDDGDRAWEPDEKKSLEAFLPRGTKGTKRAYESALKAFQDLVREFDLPSSRRVVSPEATHTDCVNGENGSGEIMSDHGGKTSRTVSGSMPELQPNDSDDNIDTTGPATRASTAEEDEEATLTTTVLPPPARFCSADACSVRKDVTRKARRLLPTYASPSGAELGQQIEMQIEILNGGVGGSYAGIDGSDHFNNDGGTEQQQRRPVSASHFDSRHIFNIYHERDLRERPTTCRTEYIRACAELSLSPIPVFDNLLASGSSRESRPNVPAAGHEGNGQSFDAACTPVFDLDLRSYGLGPKRSLALAAFLRTFCVAEIRSLNIEGCGVPETAMAAVVQALKDGRRGLTALDISANQIKTERSATLISELLEQPASSLTSLRMRGCSLSLAALTALLLPMHDRRCALKSLCLSRNRLGGVGAGAALACLVDNNVSLTNLDLSDNRLSGQQLAMILQALAVNSSILTLDIGWNSLCEDQVADALIEALKDNRTLTKLEVGYSGLGEETCLRLSEVLLGNDSGIRHLGVAGTAIGPFGAQGLLMALGVNEAGRASGGTGDTDDEEANSDEDGAWDENVGKRGGGGWSNDSTADNRRIADRKNTSASTDNGTIANRNNTSGGTDNRGIANNNPSRNNTRDNTRNNNSGSTNNRSISNRTNTSGSTRSSFGGVGGGGGEGRRARRTIDMAHSCLARKASGDGSMDRVFNASAFDPTAPNGDYTLDLSNALDRHVARRLQGLAGTQSGKCWVQSKLNKKTITFPVESPSSFELPETGLLQLTFAANRPVTPPAWKEKHIRAALQKIEVAGDGVDELAGVRLAETIIELHPITVAQGHAMLSTFSSSARPTVAAALIRHMPNTEDAEQILDGLHPNEREKVEDVGSMGLLLRWFSSKNPTCRYRLRLGIPCERMAATRLADLNMLERRALQLADMKDMSQNGNWDNFRNGTLDGEPFLYPPGGGWVPPPQGLFCVDYVSPFLPACVGREAKNPPSPMSDQDFRDFLAAYVVLEDEPAPLRSEGADKTVREAFDAFDKGGQDPAIAQALMTKACGFPRTPTLQQVRDGFAEIRLEFPPSPQHEEGDSSAVNGDQQGVNSGSVNTSNNEGDDPGDVADNADGKEKVDASKTEADKAKATEGGEENGEPRGDLGDPEKPLDLGRFAHVWRFLMVRSLAERRMPLLRRNSSRVWLSTDQLSRVYYGLKRDKRNPCDPVEAVVFFFRRLTDPENLHRFTTQLPDDDMERVGDALGWLNVFNPFRPDGHYRLNFNRPDEKRVAAAVMELVGAAMEAGKTALAQAFPSGAFGIHNENFIPPKTWKRVLPLSGRWSFKLALESRRIDPSSSSSSSSSPSSSTPNNGNGNRMAHDSGNQQQQLGGPHSMKSAPEDHDGQTVRVAQAQEGETYDAAGSTPKVPPSEVDTPAVLGTDDASNKCPSADLQDPAAAVTTQERIIDNWPGRKVCRDVAEKFLSWKFQDDDFCLPAAGNGADGEVADSCVGDMDQQREEQSAVRTALVRRQAILWSALNDLRTNDEAGVVGAG